MIAAIGALFCATFALGLTLIALGLVAVAGFGLLWLLTEGLDRVNTFDYQCRAYLKALIRGNKNG